MNTTMIALVAAECRLALKLETTTRDRAKVMMKVARNHWMVTDEQEQFQGAVAALYEVSDEETRKRIEVELKALATLNALFSGVDVNSDLIKPLENPIGLAKLWHDSKRE